MTKQTESTTPQPTLAEILAAESNEVAELEAKLAEAKAADAEQKANAQAMLDEQLAPVREERNVAIQAIAEAAAARTEALAPIEAAHAKKVETLNAKFEVDTAKATEAFDAAIADAKASLAALEERVLTEMGIPAVVLNMDIAPAPKAKTARKSSATGTSTSRKSPKVADLGVVGPVSVTAPHRYPVLDPSNPTTVVYEVAANDEGVLELFAKRVDHVVDGVHVINAEAVAGGYTHHDTVASKVTSAPGWHSTKDVMFALTAAAGKVGEYPEFGPESSPLDILVDGTPLATQTSEEEVTIKETV